MWRILYGRQPLHRAGIGKPEAANVSVGPTLPRCPFNRVEAVVAFVFVRTKFTAGIIATTHILDENGVAAPYGVLERRVFLLGRFSAVRRAVHQHGKTAVRGRPPNIRAKGDAIAHGNVQGLLNRWLVLVLP